MADSGNCGTGRRVRVAVVDSGVYAAHPHVRGVAGGVSFDGRGCEGDDYLDRLGHGTAVAAVIKETAPEVELFAIRIFDRSLSTGIEALVAALAWAARTGIQIVNLSLGTSRSEHAGVLREAVDRARAAGTTIVAAASDGRERWWPGSLPSVVPVQLDWTCPRDRIRVISGTDGRLAFAASGYPRDIPGVPPERNLRGISFAVAHVTGFAARVLETRPDRPLAESLGEFGGWTGGRATAADGPDRHANQE